MKTKIFIATALLSFAIVAINLLGDINGKWTGTATSPDGDIVGVHYTFKVDNGILSGSTQMTANPYEISEGKVKGDSLWFSIVVDNGDKIINVGKYYAAGDSISLNFSFMGGAHHVTLKRDADK